MRGGKMRTLIKNITIVDATGVRKGKVLTEDRKIKKVYKEKGNCRTAHDNEIDGQGKILMPGFIDMHCHLRDPGLTYKEDMESGMKAALKGGFTTLVAMANTKPVMDDAEKLKTNLEKAKNLNLGHLIQVCALTKGFSPFTFVDFEKTRLLTPIFSNDGYNIDEIETLKKALMASAEYDFILATHNEPEEKMVVRDCQALESIPSAHLHICHISTQKTLETIKKAKAKGLDVTCEVTPHHLYASALQYRVHPPFRSYSDRKALIEGVKDGSIDICATDHAPHSEEDKLNGAPGINNFETAFAMYHTVFKGANIPLTRLSQMMSEAPAKRLGLKAGLIKERYAADFVLIDPEIEWQIQPKAFISKSHNTPFAHERVMGKVLMTFVEGDCKYDNGSFV